MTISSMLYGKLRYILTICFGIICTAAMASASFAADLNPADTDANIEQKPATSCCGGAGPNKIHWERIVNDEVVDFGGWYVGREGVAYNGVPTSDGSLLMMIAIRLPYPEGQSYPVLDPKVHYFNGVNPDLGLTIITEEHTKGEKWLFQIGDRLITDDTGFYPVNTELSFNYGPGAEPSSDVQVLVPNGNWLYMECGGHPKFMFGPPGCQLEEVYKNWHGIDWQKLKGTKVPIPPELGQFYGFAHAVGEIWRVKIGGKEYTVVATEVEPSAIELPK